MSTKSTGSVEIPLTVGKEVPVTVKYPVAFKNPFKCAPFVILIILVVIIILFILFSKVPGAVKWGAIVGVIVSLFFFGLSIYLLCCMGRVGWAWIVLIVPIVLLIISAVAVKNKINTGIQGLNNVLAPFQIQT